MSKSRDLPFVGVDLGGTNIQAGVLGPKNKLLGAAKSKTKADEGSETVVERVVKTVHEALDDAKLKLSDIGGVGIGAPGAIDPDKGIVQVAVNLRWNKFPLAKLLSAELEKTPVTLDNDVNVGTWAEHQVGAAKGFDDCLGVFVGTGIGGGLVLGGKLYHGHFLTAGEIGHTVIHADSQRGRRTLENCASRTAVTSLLVQLIQTNHKSVISDLVKADYTDVRSKVLAQAIDENDPLAVEVIQKAAKDVGIAIANVVTVMSLPCVVLGGGLTEALGKRWVEWVRESFETYVFPPDLKRCKIVAAKLGDDAGRVGAALLARERLGS
jgi:glucokinase